MVGFGLESYFVECNETLSLAPDQMALIEPEDRLLRAGASHVPLFVRGHLDPVELLLSVGVPLMRVKENARIARVTVVSHRRRGKAAQDFTKRQRSKTQPV